MNNFKMELITAKINSLEEEIKELHSQLKAFMFSHKKTIRVLLKKIENQNTRITLLEQERPFNDASIRSIYQEFATYRERTDTRFDELFNRYNNADYNPPSDNNIYNTQYDNNIYNTQSDNNIYNEYILTEYNIRNGALHSNLNNFINNGYRSEHRQSPRINIPPRNIPPEGVEIPREFICPITLEIMESPVIVSDGNSYESSAIRAVMATDDGRSPLTREILNRNILIPNHNLRKMISDFCEGD